MGDPVAFLSSIQMLRAIAAIMVVVFHVLGANSTTKFDEGLLVGLRSGVDLFFVISGFVMWVSTARTRTSPIQFYRARIRRIVPLYWMVTTALLGIYWISPGALKSFRFDLVNVIGSYFFIPTPSPIPGHEGTMWPALVVGWSLNLEMGFYLVFGALLLLQVRHRAIAAIAIFGTIGALSLVMEPTWQIPAFYVSYRVAEFAFGILLGVLYVQGRAIHSAWLSGLTAAIGFFLLSQAFNVFGFSKPMDWVIVSAASLVVVGFIGLETTGVFPTTRLGAKLGDASYALYLTHPLSVSAVMLAARRFGFGGSLLADMTVSFAAVAIAITVAVLVHTYIERPLVHALRHPTWLAATHKWLIYQGKLQQKA